jgi:voltage-gated potassium channel
MPKLSLPFGASPLVRRAAWHLRRVVVGFVVVAAIVITLLEKPLSVESMFDSFNWGLSTVLGVGDAAFVTSPGGRIVNWLLILFGVALLATITGALVAMVIDFLLKEGQGLGASGYQDHVVVCGWNTTARDLLNELRGDDYKMKVVVIADLEKSPAGGEAYYVRGDATDADTLERAGIRQASAALIFPSDPSDAADMQSILTIMAIESTAPGVRTVAEVNNPRHEPHFRRAGVNELLVTSKIASHLLARSALYPGLTGIVTDIVSGGDGSELYRVTLPDDYCGRTLDEVARLMRSEHHATLLSINRGGQAFVNPGADFRLEPGDDAIVVAESLGELAPLKLRDATVHSQTAAVVPSA